MKQGETRWGLFDIDNTMYPKNSGVMEAISSRISAYMIERLGMDRAQVRKLRPRYWKEYGTTLRGLCVESDIDPEDYLSYVHDFSVGEMLAPNAELDRVLGSLPWRKVILTSASSEHAHTVLTALGVRQHFERLFGIRDTGYVCKPHPSAYRTVFDALNISAELSIMLDDSIANLRAAGALGMITVLVGPDHDEDGADFVIGRIEEAADVACQFA